MEEKIIKTLLEAPPVQKKLRKVAQRTSWKGGSGQPTVSDREVLREAMKEEGINPAIIENPTSLVERELLSEISILDSKYENIPFYPRESRAFMEVIKNEGLEEPDPPLTKMSQPGNEEEAVVVEEIGTGDPYEVWMEDSSGTQYLARFTNKGKLGGSFSRQSTSGINWTSRGVKTYEVAACFGLACQNERNESPEDFLSGASTEQEIEVLAEEVIDVFNANYDWSEEGRAEFVNQIQSEDGLTVSDVSQLASYAQGMWKFWKQEASSNIDSPYFVHGSIEDYYAAEEANGKVETRGDKKNTADFLLCGQPAGQVIQRMREGEDVEFTEDGACYFDTGNPSSKDYFYQVSHKKSIGKGDAQLGKFLSSFRKNIGLDDDQFDQVVRYMSTQLDEEVINEGFADQVKSVTDTVKNKAGIFVNKIEGGLNRLRRLFYDALEEMTASFDDLRSNFESYFEGDTKAVSDFYSNAEKSLVKNDYLPLQESFSKSEIEKAMIEAWSDGGVPYEEVIVPHYKNMQKWYNELAQEIKSDETLGTFGDMATSFEPSNAALRLIVGQDREEADYVLRQVNATHQALNAFHHMVFDEEGVRKDAKETVKDFIEIEREMYFGKTLLPVWKVGGSDYKPLGDGKTFKEEKVDLLDFEKINEMPPLVLFEVKPKPGDPALWATTNYAIVSDISEDGEFLYTKYAARSRGGTLDFTTEGRASGLTIDEL